MNQDPKFSATALMIKSAAESELVWDEFLPPERQDIFPWNMTSPPKSKKELFMALSSTPVLIDGGNMSFSLDKWSGKKCYMIAAKRLRIAWGDTPKYWKWISLPNTRFEEVAELQYVGWFEIRGRIATRLLSPFTLYKAYLVYKFIARPLGFDDYPTTVAVSARTYGFDYECPNLEAIIAGEGLNYNAFLVQPKREISDARVRKRRADGWLEIELGEFLCGEEEDRELEMICCEISASSKAGIIVQGIELSPKGIGDQCTIMNWNHEQLMGDYINS